jgi:hypothetical protein
MSRSSERIIPLETFATSHGKRHFDILLTAYSYEERIVDSLKRSIESFDIGKSILIVYDGRDYLEEHALNKWLRNKEEICKLLTASHINTHEISCKHDEVTEISQHLKEIVGSNQTLLIDITGMTKNYILKLAQIFDSEHTYYLYTRGEIDQVPTQQEMSVSINRIETVEGFEGYTSIDKNDLVVLILGYEGNRSLAFLKKFETEPTLAIIGSPHVEDESINTLYTEAALDANRQLLNIHRVHLYEKPTHSLNPFLFAGDLETAINSYPNKERYNFCLSCLGTKLQTLGLYLYWKRNPECQIFYSVPNKRFFISSGVGKSWIIKL